MTWTPETSCGNESRKIRFEILPYVRGMGLDLGCGPAKAYPHMIGVDAEAYKTGTGANICLDVTKLDLFADQSMAFVYSSHALEDQEDTLATLAEWWRLVKVDGYLILYLPHADFYPRMGQPGANPAHKHDFLPLDIIAAMCEVAPDWELLENQERNGGAEYSFLQVYRRLPAGSGQSEPWKAPRPPKTAAVVRYGAYGDALWAASVLPALKAEGYHVTVYTQEPGEEVLRHDPHLDRIIVHSEYLTPATEFSAYWEHERPKYDRWINLAHSVEARLLPAPHDLPFHWPEAIRRRRMAENYLETVHEFAGVPYALRAQKFYPTTAELAWAFDKRTELRGPVVVLNAAGSTWPKWWPHGERFAALLAEQGVHTVIVGDWRAETPALHPRFGHFIGCDWTIRQAMAFATLADVVVGVESAIVNAVAFEPLLKVVLLSHSAIENLTRDWVNTISAWPLDLACYPCHRLHGDATYCTPEGETAACQARVSAERVAEHVLRYVGERERVAA